MYNGCSFINSTKSITSLTDRSCRSGLHENGIQRDGFRLGGCMAAGQLMSLLIVLVAASQGCSLSAANLHGDVAAISRLDSNVEAARRIQALGERVQHFSEDVVTEAYLKSTSEKERSVMLDVVGWSGHGDGRFVPLLCYVTQTSETPGERAHAARLLGDIRRLPQSCNRFRLLWILGESFADERDNEAADVMAYALCQCLRNLCGYEIRDATKVAGSLRIFGGMKVHTVDTAVVRKWWETEGREIARRGDFEARAEQ